MQTTNGSEIVFRNPQPKREPHYPNLWSLLVGDQWLRVFAVQDGTHRPHVAWREAA